MIEDLLHEPRGHAAGKARLFSKKVASAWQHDDMLEAARHGNVGVDMHGRALALAEAVLVLGVVDVNQVKVALNRPTATAAARLGRVVNVDANVNENTDVNGDNMSTNNSNSNNTNSNTLHMNI